MSSTSDRTSSSSGGVMDKAKATVNKFINKGGQNDTTVHESVNRAVVHEKVQPTRHEDVTTAIDREVHQDHHHTTVQPVQDRQVLPEKHQHNVMPTENRHIEHGNAKDTESRLAAEAAKYKDEQYVLGTKETHSAAPTVSGEHVHHHVHENVQPVIERQTIQPEVVHTTVPVHETHHNATKHHSTTVAPAVTMDQFQKKGGVVDGQAERTRLLNGEPTNLSGIGRSLAIK